MQYSETTASDSIEILVVGPSWIGDMVMAQSLFKTIKSRSADCKITVLSPKWSEPVLQRMPEVDHVIEMTVGHGSLQLMKRLKLARLIRLNGFDQAIVLPGSLKSALVPWLAGIPKRTGYVGEQRWGLLNDIRNLDKKAMPLNVRRYISLALGKSEVNESARNFTDSNTLLANLPYPKLTIDQNLRDRTRARYRLGRTRPVIALCPGAEYGPAKRWPPEYFAEVAREKTADGWQVWIFGSANDAKIGEQINDLSNGICINLCGKTTLGEAVDLMSYGQYAVTNDSGLMHIAAAVGCHVIAIFGSSSDQFTPPLTEQCDRLNLNLSCSPCFQRECPLGHLNCLKQLKPERVLKFIV